MTANRNSIFLKALKVIDSLIATFQVLIFFLYFTPFKNLFTPFITEQMGSYDSTTAFVFLISAIIFLIVIRGLVNKRKWAILLQAILFMPLIGAFPVGTLLFLLLVYGLWKLEKSGGFG